jgi:hypothetical protein
MGNDQPPIDGDALGVQREQALYLGKRANGGGVSESEGVRGDCQSPPSSDSPAAELAKEFRLSTIQRSTVSEYFQSHGSDYVFDKADIVRSQRCRNAAGAFLSALREDWQPRVSVGDPKTNDDLTQRMGWEL